MFNKAKEAKFDIRYGPYIRQVGQITPDYYTEIAHS
jgi:hypothetical protein